MHHAPLVKIVQPPRNPIRKAAIILGATLAICLGIGALQAQRRLHCFCHSKPDLALIEMKQIVDEAMPQWRMHHAQACPDDSSELAAELDRRELRDPWGQLYALQCRDGHAIVRSAGPDNLFGTDDDLGPPLASIVLLTSRSSDRTP